MIWRGLWPTQTILILRWRSTAHLADAVHVSQHRAAAAAATVMHGCHELIHRVGARSDAGCRRRARRHVMRINSTAASAASLSASQCRPLASPATDFSRYSTVWAERRRVLEVSELSC